MAPFITFEYYLLMFEHLMVDTSHYMGSLASSSFLETPLAPKKHYRVREMMKSHDTSETLTNYGK